jgi:hypothetical protein
MCYPQDLVDLFVLTKESNNDLSFPTRECDVIENKCSERLGDIISTRKEDLYYFQTIQQVKNLPFEEFVKFMRKSYEWLLGFC